MSMISITIEIDNIEISMTADQAIRLRDELNRLFAPIPSQPQPILPMPIYPSPTIDPYPWWRNPVTCDRFTVRQNGTGYPA